MTRFFFSGNGERAKCVYHATIAGLALGAVIYNAAAWVLRRETHLAANVGIYGGLALLEARKVAHHRKAVLVLLVALLTTACHGRAPVATTPTPRPDRYALPVEAKPDDLFCVPPSIYDVMASDWAHGLVCVYVNELREWMRARRFANP